ncbi:hypothetical protein WA026_004923 [Henosepilachna vigintioctopunctata]|uniref:Ionotropic receptor n=1 Tax=Henosepilachna vigintioctopunctata TaxID=420089 RepID=A0AAW1UU28_9CUCU
MKIYICTYLFLSRVESSTYSIRHHYWLIISKDADVLHHLNRTILNIDCNINLLVPNENSSSNFDIVDVYNPASQHGGILEYKIIGEYSDMNGYQIQKQDMKYEPRRNLSGVRFNAAVVLPIDIDFPVSEYLNYDGDRVVNAFNRFHARLMLYCRDYFNFTITRIDVLKSWGYLQKNNSFDGLVGALERNEIDFGLSPLLVRPDRLDRIDYGFGTWIFRGAFLFRKPEFSSNFNVFLKPLPFSIWISALGMFLLSVCLYKSMEYGLERNNSSKEKIGWIDLMFFIVGAISQQGSVIRPYLFSGRMVLLSVITLSYLLYQFYSASIVAYLVMKPPSLVNTPEDLLASNMECRVESTLFIMDFFLRAKDKVTSSLYRKNRRQDSNGSYFISAEVGLRKVMKGGVAFHAELATAYPIMENMFPENIICELQEIDIMGTLKAYCAFREKSPFKEMFSVVVQRLAEVGILRRELNHWHPKKPECLNLSNRVKYNFGLEDLYPAFILLLSGVILSIILNFVEAYGVFRKQQR